MEIVETIFLVDDEEEQLHIVSALLQSCGFRVWAFSCPEEALLAIEREPCDLLISDLRLPLINGMEFIKQVKEINARIECILMTGNSSVDTAIDAMRLGVADYLLKPFHASELKAVVNRVLYVKRLKDQNEHLLESLKHSNAQLRDLNAQLDSFAGRVAHDLNSMISLIQSYSRALDKNITSSLDENSKKFLGRIRTVSDRGSALVSDLLSFARLGNKSLKLSKVDVGEVVERARIFAELDAKQPSIDWQIDKLPSLQADESLIEQVFANLFSNGVKYTRHVDRPCIAVKSWDTPEFHFFAVQDNGAGFDPDRKDELFQPFKRLHDAYEFEGNGLGLVNVKRIVEKHGGQIRADGKPGKGAKFEFCIRKTIEVSLPIISTDAHADQDCTGTTVCSVPTNTRLPASPMDDLLVQCVHKLNNVMLPFVLELDERLANKRMYTPLDQRKLTEFDQSISDQLAAIKRLRALISKRSLIDFEG
ncbi:MAG TPA: response regulator [Limnobacter sp.]|nr:response regulator [Limnobacter sp.]